MNTMELREKEGKNARKSSGLVEDKTAVVASEETKERNGKNKVGIYIF